MGAQTPKRLEQFTERYKHFDDPMGKYLYIQYMPIESHHTGNSNYLSSTISIV